MDRHDARDDQPELAPAAVITGATQGIGRALAEEFAKHGHTLLLVARNEEALAKTAREIASAHDVPAHHAACDLATPEGCDQLVEVLRTKGLYCESLVNNAAIMTAGFFQDQDREQLLKIVDLNVRAVVDLTRASCPTCWRATKAASSTSLRWKGSCRCPIRRLTPPPRRS
ncbi:hypothetical protein AUC71_12880 [Methyloceanibacter marginalis]|uniref:Short-chain dehydrogenase n=1 Tax=Methyloceanibacter marginalis TaxID=1774971 RepID=A0A1E3WAQ1_9HYPH|nr:hypothetical protein AUC71_12880 [Methyloceanibacter marginalis]